MSTDFAGIFKGAFLFHKVLDSITQLPSITLFFFFLICVDFFWASRESWAAFAFSLRSEWQYFEQAENNQINNWSQTVFSAVSICFFENVLKENHVMFQKLLLEFQPGITRNPHQWLLVFKIMQFISRWYNLISRCFYEPFVSVNECLNPSGKPIFSIFIKENEVVPFRYPENEPFHA